MRRTKWDWTLREWRDYYDKLRHKAEYNYQDSGESRYDRECMRYEVIVDAMNKAMEYEDERDNERKRRMHNIEAYMERLGGRSMYSRADLDKIVTDIKHM